MISIPKICVPNPQLINDYCFFNTKYVIYFSSVLHLSVTVHHHLAQDFALPPQVVAGAALPPGHGRHGARRHPHAARSLHTQLQASQQGQSVSWIFH